jgi:membrane-associated phospholipid phosphatase
MMKLQLAVSVFVLLILALEITLAYFFLLDSGSDFSVTLQDNSNLFFDILWWMSFIITIPLLTKIKLIMFYFYSPSKGMELVILSVAVAVIGNLLKLIIAYPRPFWFSEDVIAKTCSFSYGDPSLHSMLTVSILTYAVWRMEKRNFYYAFAAGYVMIVCFERTYGGVHTYSQLLLGIILGLYFVFLFWQNHPYLKSIIKDLKSNPFSRNSLILGTVSICLALLLYYIRNPWWDEDWDSNAEEHCGDFNEKVAMKAQFLECIYIVYYYGAALGFYYIFATGVKLKTTQRWQKALIMLGCLSSHIACKFIRELRTGTFVADIFFNAFVDFVEGFLCFGGVCLPFDCLRKEDVENVEKKEESEKEKLLDNEEDVENVNN